MCLWESWPKAKHTPQTPPTLRTALLPHVPFWFLRGMEEMSFWPPHLNPYLCLYFFFLLRGLFGSSLWLEETDKLVLWRMWVELGCIYRREWIYCILMLVESRPSDLWKTAWFMSLICFWFYNQSQPLICKGHATFADWSNHLKGYLQKISDAYIFQKIFFIVFIFRFDLILNYICHIRYFFLIFINLSTKFAIIRKY